MNRTERLHALGEELRRAGSRGRTAGNLAAWLEVSTRTIKRDVAALQQSGVPIWAQAGPGGGYVLDATATLPPINLSPAQAVAVAVALAAQGDAPYALAGRAALQKVLDAMGPVARGEAERLAGRVWIQGAPGRTRLMAAVEDALARRRVLSLTYCDKAGVSGRRRVEPHLIAHRRGHWYLVAWCRSRDAPRWFRLDRIEAAHVSADTVPDRDVAVFGTPPEDAEPVGPRRTTDTEDVGAPRSGRS